MILVAGATGNAGGAVIRALHGADEMVPELVRREAAPRLPAGVDAATADLSEPGTGEVVRPAVDIRLDPFVDADDITDVAVAALTEPGHAGQVDDRSIR
jgi:uncharacterized protein YbjT (DUF2867 family)